MRPIPGDELDQILSRFDIRVAAPARGIGREITYGTTACRTVIVHLAEVEPLEYVESVVSRILDLSDEWLLLARHGSVSDLGLLQAPAGAAISFARPEHRRLAEYLCTRATTIDSVSADLYVLASDGRTLVTWDHHTAAEGLEISLNSVADTTRLLVALNELGVELELLYRAG
jgi:hypothetical protein